MSGVPEADILTPLRYSCGAHGSTVQRLLAFHLFICLPSLAPICPRIPQGGGCACAPRTAPAHRQYGVSLLCMSSPMPHRSPRIRECTASAFLLWSDSLKTKHKRACLWRARCARNIPYAGHRASHDPTQPSLVLFACAHRTFTGTFGVCPLYPAALLPLIMQYDIHYNSASMNFIATSHDRRGRRNSDGRTAQDLLTVFSLPL